MLSKTDEEDLEKLLQKTLSNIIGICNKESLASLALPCLSNKVSGISPDVFVKSMFKVVKGYTQKTLASIRLAIDNRSEASSYIEEFEKSFQEGISISTIKFFVKFGISIC